MQPASEVVYVSVGILLGIRQMHQPLCAELVSPARAAQSPSDLLFLNCYQTAANHVTIPFAQCQVRYLNSTYEIHFVGLSVFVLYTTEIPHSELPLILVKSSVQAKLTAPITFVSTEHMLPGIREKKLNWR